MHGPGISPAHNLTQELEAARSLLQALQQEQAHLIDADVDGVAKMTEEKSRIVVRMSELAKQRHLALASAGFDATESGMQAWINAQPPQANAGKTWTELLELSKSAKEQNRVNGLLIAQHLSRNQSALNILQGNAQGGAIYGPDGQSTTKIGSRRLVVG